MSSNFNIKTYKMKELKRHNLRTDYRNETVGKIRTEHYVRYNHDYVKWLEDRLLKLLIIGDVSNTLDLHELDKRLSEVLDSETADSLISWLNMQRQ
jgi:radical SAM superfamily enzyme